MELYSITRPLKFRIFRRIPWTSYIVVNFRAFFVRFCIIVFYLGTIMNNIGEYRCLSNALIPWSPKKNTMVLLKAYLCEPRFHLALQYTLAHYESVSLKRWTQNKVLHISQVCYYLSELLYITPTNSSQTNPSVWWDRMNRRTQIPSVSLDKDIQNMGIV